MSEETAAWEAARLLDEWRMTFFSWLTPIENRRIGDIVENIRERTGHE